MYVGKTLTCLGWMVTDQCLNKIKKREKQGHTKNNDEDYYVNSCSLSYSYNESYTTSANNNITFAFITWINIHLLCYTSISCWFGELIFGNRIIYNGFFAWTSYDKSICTCGWMCTRTS